MAARGAGNEIQLLGVSSMLSVSLADGSSEEAVRMEGDQGLSLFADDWHDWLEPQYASSTFFAHFEFSMT